MYLVFDVGGTFIKYAWMSGEGEIVEKGKCKTPVKPGQGVKDFLQVLVDIYHTYKQKDEVQGIAIGIPGQVDVERGIVYGGGGLRYMDGVCLGTLLSERCDNVRVSLENDGKCAALAEVFVGNAKDVQNACVLVFGTGIGGGIIKDRKVHRGNHMLAGELSFCIDNMTKDDLELTESIPDIEHMTVVESFDKVPFMWSCAASTAAMVHRVAKLKGLSDDDVNGELIYQWVEEGDADVTDILEREYFSIAKQCCNLYVIFDPDVILIGGGISAQPLFIEGIKRYVERLKRFTKLYENIKIDVCKHRNDSNLLGALYNFRQLYEGVDGV